MLINSAVFGPLEVDARDIYETPDGLMGFDGVKQYALIQKQDEDVTLRWFQAVDARAPCFVVFNPYEIVDGYTPQLESYDRKALECQKDEDLDYLVIAVVPEDVTKTTVNLKSPIVLNQSKRKARQVILANKDYPIRFPLTEEQS